MGKSTFLQDFKAFAMKGNVMTWLSVKLSAARLGKSYRHWWRMLLCPNRLIGWWCELYRSEMGNESGWRVGADGKEIAPAVSLIMDNFCKQLLTF